MLRDRLNYLGRNLLLLILATSVSISNAQNNSQRQTFPGKLMWVDGKGAQEPLDAPVHTYRSPRLSPDGNLVAVTIEESGGQIWIYDLHTKDLRRLTPDDSRANLYATWTPDGKHIAFESGSPGNLFWQASDGRSKAERLFANQYAEAPSSWSPDGRRLAFWENNPTNSRDLWILLLDERKPELFLQTPSSEAAAQFSPDGHWLAYTTDKSGQPEIVVRPYPGPGAEFRVSINGGTEPLWRRDGRELFYREGNKMMAADVAITAGSFSSTKPKQLFDGNYALNPAATDPNYDVTSDGQRFLMIQPVNVPQ